MNELVADIQNALQALFSGTIQSIHPCWEPCEWSKVYRLQLHDGTRLFLKGTPRSRNEALVMQRLHDLCPACIPRVLVTDLVPSASWRWFLIEDAGNADQSALSRSVALEAARTLGQLQHRALQDQTLPSLLVRCEGDRLQQQAIEVCRWAMTQQPPEVRTDLQRIASLLEQAHTFFGELAEQLAELPSTIVHGDFWSGNIAVAGSNIRFIDWGDALWGAGGVSIVNLLMTSDGQLDNAALQIWEAYEQGWERAISPAYRQACQAASAVADLVIDRAIAMSCGRGPERLQGLVPGLRDLEELIAGQVIC
jgi:aminoglycoside phosphotransferase (APT) family kinase protein